MKNLIFKSLILISILFLGSCNSLREWKEDRRASRYEKFSQDCVRQGFTRNTDALRLCVQNLEIKRDAYFDRLINRKK